MICQLCKKKPATFHYTSNQNGDITETHLCHECAKKSGLIEDSYKIFNPLSFADGFSDTENSMLADLLGSMLESTPAHSIKESTVCPFCGMRLHEFMHNGKAGCGRCYTTFRNALEPTLKKLHGNTKHTGKIPLGANLHKSKKQKISELEKLLKTSVENQEYEKAAEYRDQIKELENTQEE